MNLDYSFWGTNLLLFATFMSPSQTNIDSENYPIEIFQNHPEGISYKLSEYSGLDIESYSRVEEKKIQTILKFAENLISNSQDMDGEFVDIVNENFWDLI